MSIRRYLRIKSLQFLYAQYLSKINFEKVEKNMIDSIKDLNNLYIYLLRLLLIVREYGLKKNYKKLNLIFNNSIFKKLSNNKFLIKKCNFNKYFWVKQKNYISLCLKKIQNSDIYKKKIDFSFYEEKKLLINYYEIFFVLNEQLIEHISDFYIGQEENLPIAHNMVYKTFNFIKKSTPSNFKLYDIYNNKDNHKFIIDLYRNTISHKKEFNILIKNASINWDIKRISTIDLIILQMAICEFLYFPNIPPKATINEYIEITKIFCMYKSKFFINGILDKILKLLNKKNKIFKIGKGLM